MIDVAKQIEFWVGDSRDQQQSAAIRKRRRTREPGSKKGLLPRDKDTSRHVRLVLASGSPSKIRILELLGLQFSVDPANIDERSVVMPTAEELVCELAFRKATAVSARHRNALILGADTLILDKWGHLGKPADMEAAREMLSRLSGKTHKVVTGLVLIDPSANTHVKKLAVTNVKFRNLSPRTIMHYVRTQEPLGKAGAYALQGMGGLLIENVDGEFNNVLGLPVVTFVDALSELGYELI